MGAFAFLVYFFPIPWPYSLHCSWLFVYLFCDKIKHFFVILKKLFISSKSNSLPCQNYGFCFYLWVSVATVFGIFFGLWLRNIGRKNYKTRSYHLKIDASSIKSAINLVVVFFNPDFLNNLLIN